MIRKTALLFAATLVLAQAASAAGRDDAQARGRVFELKTTTTLRGGQARADADAIAGKLSAAYGIARDTPILREPRGFSLEPMLSVGGDARGGGRPLVATLTLAFRPIHLAWDSTQHDAASGTYFTPHPFMALSVVANEPRGVLAEPAGSDARGDYYFAPSLADRGNGVYEGHNGSAAVWLYSASGRLPYRPVSVGRYLEGEIARARAESDEAAALAGEAGEPAGDGMPDKAQMLAQIEETGRELRAAGIDPAQVEKMLAEMRAGIEGMQIPAHDPAGDAELAALAAEATAVPRDHLRALERELAALTPARRQAPACQWLRDPEGMPASGLDFECRDPRGLLVELDPDWFDPRQPVSAIQLLAVYYDDTPSGDPGFSYLDVAAAAGKALDYARLRALAP